MTGDVRFCQLYSPDTKKWVRPPEPKGPPRAAEVCLSESSVIAFPLGALEALNPESFATVSDGRNSPRTSPCSSDPPLLVTMFTTPPVVAPYSAENAFSNTVISCTLASGRLVKAVCLPQL